jgi:hypothetical protein
LRTASSNGTVSKLHSHHHGVTDHYVIATKSLHPDLNPLTGMPETSFNAPDCSPAKGACLRPPCTAARSVQVSVSVRPIRAQTEHRTLIRYCLRVLVTIRWWRHRSVPYVGRCSDLYNTTVGYGVHSKHRNPRTLPIQSFPQDCRRTLVRAEYGYPKGYTNTNS